MLLCGRDIYMDKKYVAILGSGTRCEANNVDKAQNLGYLIAEKGWIIVVGGIGGLFKEVAIGAKSIGGQIIVIAEDLKPQKELEYESFGHIIWTGLGPARRSIISNTVDGGIMMDGWIGSLDLALLLISQNKSVFGIQGTGGIVDIYLKSDISDKDGLKIISVKSIEEAVDGLARAI
jgi:uncharacterized protein (TIGR00725 family)